MKPRPRSEPQEHPVTALLAVAAILMTGLAIFSVYLELNGIREIEVAFCPTPPISAGSPVHASLQSWATGFSN
jgi:hypothetical protein